MLSELFDWDHFITPKLARVVFYLYLVLVGLLVLSGLASSLATMSFSLIGGLFGIVATLIGGVIGVIFARVFTELILIVFKIEEHLAAVRKRWEA